MGWVVAFWILAVLWVVTVGVLVWAVEKIDDLKHTIRIREAELISHRKGEARWPQQ